MTIHKSVLLKETIDNLDLKSGSIVVDATFGGGGHSREILKKIGENGKLIAIDADVQAIERFIAENPKSKLQISNKFQIQNPKIQNIGNIILVNDNFKNLDRVLEELEIEKVDAIMADLGWSSDQLIGKGMSFMRDEKLDMRLDTRQELSAEKIVNEYSEEELGRVIREYGEEKFWKKIVERIIEYRKEKKIETTAELAGIVESAVPGKYRHGKINPATKTFQALRIEVNCELENLEKFLQEAIVRLKSGGRLAVISFHSLEDRIVKNIFRENARGCICPKNFPQCVCAKQEVVKVITRKPILSSDEETLENPRSRSAKLRVCEKN